MEASCSLSSLIQHRPRMQLRQPLEHGAWHAEEAISVQREDIMWLMYNSVSHGWHCTWLERKDSARERDTWKSRVLFPFFIGYIQNWKPHPRFYQSNCRPIHLNYTWMRTRAITALQNSKARRRFECVPLFSLALFFLSLIIFPLPLSSFIFLCWYLHVNDFCVSAFLSLSRARFFFLSAIYMSVALTAWWCCVEMKVICFVTVRPFYQLLLSSILVSEYWWQWNQGAVKKFCKLSC